MPSAKSLKNVKRGPELAVKLLSTTYNRSARPKRHWRLIPVRSLCPYKFHELHQKSDKTRIEEKEYLPRNKSGMSDYPSRSGIWLDNGGDENVEFRSVDELHGRSLGDKDEEEKSGKESDE